MLGLGAGVGLRECVIIKWLGARRDGVLGNVRLIRDVKKSMSRKYKCAGCCN